MQDISSCTNTTEVLSLIASISTIAATIVAICGILFWRKQQKYVYQIELLMTLEDSYELYFATNIEEFNSLLERLREKTDKEKTSTDYSLYKREYEIAFLRAKRFFNQLENRNEFSVGYMDKVFENHLHMLRECSADDECRHDVFAKYSNKLLELKSQAIKTIEEIRKSL